MQEHVQNMYAMFCATLHDMLFGEETQGGAVETEKYTCYVYAVDVNVACIHNGGMRKKISAEHPTSASTV